MASLTLTMSNSWCSGTLTTSQSLSSDARTVTITATAKLWRNDGGTSYNYDSVNDFTITIAGNAKSFTVDSISGTTGVTLTHSYAFNLNADGSGSAAVSITGGLTGTTFQISGNNSLTHTVTGGAKATYTVSYNANGGSGAPSSQTKTYGTALTLSSTIPTRDGYDFLGWATSSSATTATYAAGGSYTANSAATLYAVWGEVATYIVTFNANGGSGAPSSQEKTHNIALTLSSTVPTRSGYTFLGWGTSSTSKSAVFEAGGTYNANKDITLYAVWKNNSQTIKIRSDGTIQGFEFIEHSSIKKLRIFSNGNVQVYEVVETDDGKFKFLSTGVMKTQEIIESNG